MPDTFAHDRKSLKNHLANGAGHTFLYVNPRERSQTLSADRPIFKLRSPESRATISSSVMSLRASIMASTKPAWGDNCDGRFERKRGAVSPFAARSIQRIAVEAATPKRSAHFRAERPLVDAFKTRSRKSMLNARRPIQITLHGWRV